MKLVDILTKCKTQDMPEILNLSGYRITRRNYKLRNIITDGVGNGDEVELSYVTPEDIHWIRTIYLGPGANYPVTTEKDWNVVVLLEGVDYKTRTSYKFYERLTIINGPENPLEVADFISHYITVDSVVTPAIVTELGEYEDSQLVAIKNILNDELGEDYNFVDLNIY